MSNRLRPGTYFYFLHSRFSLNGADTRQRVEEPFINLPHHKVIPRRTLPRVPLLGQRGSSEFQLETIAGCFFMVVHGVHQLIQPVTRQSLEQITVTHITGGQPVAVAFLYPLPDYQAPPVCHQREPFRGTKARHCCTGFPYHTDECPCDKTPDGMLY